MARSSRRQSSWEPLDQRFNTGAPATIVGDEIITEAMVTEWGPGTLVRIRGVLTFTWTTGAAGLSEPTLILCVIRKIRLARTDSTYAAPSNNLFDGPYLAQEDILWTGCAVLVWTLGERAVDTFAGSRGAAVLEVDIKAKRRFQSAEERLVLEAQPLDGDSSPVQITSVLRGLILAG